MSAIAPLHDWKRHHPMANLIALDILHHRDLLGLRAGRIATDVVTRYRVHLSTARRAVALARKNAGISR
jgi:hypothetical protein